LTVSDFQTSIAGEWFSNRTGGIIGGLLGTTAGGYGALFGGLCSFLPPRGKGRRLLTGMVIFAVVIGIVSLTVGILALFLGQPFHVWYPFVLCGGLLIIFFPSLFPAIRKRYEQVELRKLQALDI
jgi:hypothetical protein